MTMFASYNKNNAKGTLLGNWVEEEALRAATGFSRRDVPDPTAPRSPDGRRPAGESTHDRVLLHANANGRTTYETSLQASTNYGDGVLRVAPGPRASLREAKLLETARRLHERELDARSAAQQHELAAARATTTLKASYAAPETALLVSATRVPRGRNGARVVDAGVDQRLTRGEVDRLDRAKLDALLQQSASSLSSSPVPVTRYSYALATGVGLDFGATCSDSSNAFARSSAFTNDLRDPTKRHAEATEPGASHDERVGMTVHQRSALQRLVLAAAQRGAQFAQLTSELARHGTIVELAAFRAAVAASALLSDKDAIHVFMHLDVDHVGAVPLADVVAFCDAQAQHGTR